MADFGMSVHVDVPLKVALERTREALAEEGFGILSEIDVAATLKAKLDVDVPPQVILGACNAPLARQGLAIEPDLGLLLPCNVVVRTGEDGRVLVSALNPEVMVTVPRRPELDVLTGDVGRGRATTGSDWGTLWREDLRTWSGAAEGHHDTRPEVLVLHANAALTPRQRLRLARAVVEDGWTISYAAAVFQVAWPTAKRWAVRYEQAGPAGMTDRSSRPHRCPRRTPRPLVRRIVHLRWQQRLGPVEIAARLGVPASTVYAVLRRCRLNRLSHIDRRTGECVRRYEHDRPGALLHVDVKKLGNIPDGGGWRYLGRQQGRKNRNTTPGKPRNRQHNPKMGTAFVHTVLDDHSRVAYAEIHDDETAATAVGVLRRAVAWFAARGITVERVLSDNGSPYRSHAWRDACLELGIKPKRTRPYRPQTNGKIERFHRTMADGWAFRRMFLSEPARRQALPGWLHEYNHHRPHTAIGRRPPISRLTNLAGQYS